MRPLQVALAAAAALLLLVPAAAAHAVLLSSEPAKGTRLATAPASVSVTLTEPIETGTLQVLDSDGARVDLDDATVTGGTQPTLRVSLPADLPDGAYRMAWRATSKDTHTTSGTVGFAVGDFAPPESTGTAAQGTPWLAASGRALTYLGLALVLGAGLFLGWVPGAASVPRRPALEALAAGAALHLLGLALLLKDLLDASTFTDASPWTTGLGRSLFVRLAAGLGALAFALLALWPRNPARSTPFAAVLLGLVAALASAGYNHAAAVSGLAGSLVDAMHLLAGAAWAGGLLVFLWLLADARRGGWGADQVRLAGVRFGTIALVAVLVLLAAGLGATLAILGPGLLRDPGRLATAWGAVLLAKVALALAMVALGAVNRYGILEPAASSGLSAWMQRGVTRLWPDLRVLDGGATAMRRFIRVEAALGVATLALAGVLASVSPPADAGAGEGASSFEALGAGQDFHGALTATPAPTVGGTSRLVVHLATHDGAAVEGNTCGRTAPDSCVAAVIGAADGGETRALQPLGGGAWGADGILWTQAGDVAVTVTVSTAEVFADRLAFTVAVRPNA